MKNKKFKVSIIGAGNVGSTFAFALMSSGIAGEIVLIDENEKKARGEVMDLKHGLSFTRPSRIEARGYEGCADSDVVVITAGASQKPGQSRLDLVKTNVNIFKSIVDRVDKYAPEAIILVVTNPVDILTYVTLKLSIRPRGKVFGSGTSLDTARFRNLIGEHCSVDSRSVHAYIIGEHGDTELALWSSASIGGMKIDSYCPKCRNFDRCGKKDELKEIFREVKNAAYRIIDLKGATNYAIGLALVRITGAILGDEKSVLPVSTLIEDYYGVNDVCLSLPSIISSKGVEQALKIDLSEEERKQFRHSSDTMKKIIRELHI